MTSTLVNEKSTHDVPVFPVPPLAKHPNADTLSVWTIPGTDYSYVGKTADWEGRVGMPAAWVPPDSLVPVARPEFAFLAPEAKYDADSHPDKLGGYARVKAKKLRGVVSYGLCVPIEALLPATEGTTADFLGVKHYEPPITGGGAKGAMTGGEVASAPNVFHVRYDVDAYLKYGRRMFTPGEPVWVTEKLHGANARYVYSGNAMHCGSRTEWKKEFASPPQVTLEELMAKVKDEARAKEIYERVVVNWRPKRNMWWDALENTPALRAFCEAHPDHVVYGEVYGQVQKGFGYDAPAGGVRFRAFDIMVGGRWLSPPDFFALCDTHAVPTVPLIKANTSFDFDAVAALCEGQSLLASHIREGVVVAPAAERWDSRVGRIKFKIINPAYLERG
jgi:RNA ligase (TIGR02306 family)